MAAPLLLDLFCGAGGCGVGYARAGFRVVGCDLNPKPLRHNPHECYEGDALSVLDMLLDGGVWHGYRLSDFAAIHASPPCKADSVISRNLGYASRHVSLIGQTRPRLEATALPWIMENVPGAPLHNWVVLCGSAFGLGIPEYGWYLRRHRLFESNRYLWSTPCQHRGIAITVCGTGTPKPIRDKIGRTITIAEKRRLMGIDWMTVADISQAIPPAYTQWLGVQLLAAIGAEGQVA